MPGLFGTLNLGARALQTQRTGVEIAGQNLANVNNPAYARQRVAISTSTAVDSGIGPQGTGSEAVRIVQIRSALIDGQIVSEGSVRGSLEAQQAGLQHAQASLGEVLDQISGGASGTGAGSTGHGISGGLSDLFGSFQTLSGDPRTLATRQSVISRAGDLTDRLREVDRRLGGVLDSLDQSVQTDVNSANALLEDVAQLNAQITRAEAAGNGQANDLRDSRQQKLEELGKFARIDVREGDSGALTVSIAGTTFVEGGETVEGLEAYRPDNAGRLFLRASESGVALTPTGGSIQGAMDARDGAVTSLRRDINSMAATLITRVNEVYQQGVDLNGGTGAVFFEGTNAGDIRVSAPLVADPSKLQISGVAGAAGNNAIALALVRLGHDPVDELGNQTFIQRHGQTVSALGEALSSVNASLEDQNIVGAMLQKQRDSVSGVSLDEEMTDLTRYQKAFAASARLITVVDQMLDDVIGLKR